MVASLLAANKALVTELINGIPHGVALLDRNLCIVAMNRYLEAMTGYQSEQARGIYAKFILRSNLGGKKQLAKKVLEGGEPAGLEGDIINRQRKKIPVQCTLTRLHDAEGNPCGLIIVMEDISLLKKAEKSRPGSSGSLQVHGHSPQMKKVFELMAVLAKTDASVLITGETGTGKDMIAEALHNASKRARQPFIKVNCGALPEALLESELFGHVKGAFTGAVSDKRGMFQLADKGTIFLTEIGDLSLPLQVKLLSVLDDQTFFPVGGSRKVQVDVRVIAATHRALRQEVERGNFREDLFYRLNVLRLHLPPLREREGDVRLLSDHFLRHFSVRLDRRIEGFSPEALTVLSRYRYPGNVRELRNIVEYAVNICQGHKVELDHLPEYMDERALMEPQPAPAIGAAPAPEHAGQNVTVVNESGNWADAEKEMIIDTLRTTGGNRSRAAAQLGWGRTTLWRKIKKYQLA